MSTQELKSAWKISCLAGSLALIAVVVLPGTVTAQQLDQGELAVSMHVPVECEIQDASLELPLYDGVNDAESSTEIQIFCTTQEILNVTFAGSTIRTLRNGFSELSYFLHADPADPQPLGPGAGLDGVPIVGGTTTEIQIFGRIPGGQSTPLVGGAYSDTVTMTLTL